MTRRERREQLLSTALDIVRTEGTDALTLARLAERAAVSRPVTYDHFGTRERLLLAMYREYDEQLGSTVRRALAERPASLQNAVNVLCTGYVEGMVAAGPECDEVAAALSGNPQTRGFRRESTDFYVELIGRAVAPFVPAPKIEPVRLLGVFSAIDGLARAAAGGMTTREEAVATATSITLAVLSETS